MATDTPAARHHPKPAGPARQYRAAAPEKANLAYELDDEKQYKCYKGLPLFCTHDRVNAAGEKEYEVTEGDLHSICENMQRLERDEGWLGRITNGHIDPDKGEHEQPELLGFYRNIRMGVMGSKPVILHDQYLKVDAVPTAKHRPYRSAEYYHGNKTIKGVALLVRDPYLELGAATYAAKNHCTLYAMQDPNAYAWPTPEESKRNRIAFKADRNRTAQVLGAEVAKHGQLWVDAAKAGDHEAARTHMANHEEAARKFSEHMDSGGESGEWHPTPHDMPAKDPGWKDARGPREWEKAFAHRGLHDLHASLKNIRGKLDSAELHGDHREKEKYRDMHEVAKNQLAEHIERFGEHFFQKQGSHDYASMTDDEMEAYIAAGPESFKPREPEQSRREKRIGVNAHAHTLGEEIARHNQLWIDAVKVGDDDAAKRHMANHRDAVERFKKHMDDNHGPSRYAKDPADWWKGGGGREPDDEGDVGAERRATPRSIAASHPDVQTAKEEHSKAADERTAAIRSGVAKHKVFGGTPEQHAEYERHEKRQNDARDKVMSTIDRVMDEHRALVDDPYNHYAANPDWWKSGGQEHHWTPGDDEEEGEERKPKVAPQDRYAHVHDHPEVVAAKEAHQKAISDSYRAAGKGEMGNPLIPHPDPETRKKHEETKAFHDSNIKQKRSDWHRAIEKHEAHLDADDEYNQYAAEAVADLGTPPDGAADDGMATDEERSFAAMFEKHMAAWEAKKNGPGFPSSTSANVPGGVKKKDYAADAGNDDARVADLKKKERDAWATLSGSREGRSPEQHVQMFKDWEAANDAHIDAHARNEHAKRSKAPTEGLSKLFKQKDYAADAASGGKADMATQNAPTPAAGVITPTMYEAQQKEIASMKAEIEGAKCDKIIEQLKLERYSFDAARERPILMTLDADGREKHAAYIREHCKQVPGSAPIRLYEGRAEGGVSAPAVTPELRMKAIALATESNGKMDYNSALTQVMAQKVG